jgi:hypothetical protein
VPSSPNSSSSEVNENDPMILAFANAPEDDEPWTDEDEAAVAESRAEFAARRTISLEEILKKYG